MSSPTATSAAAVAAAKVRLSAFEDLEPDIANLEMACRIVDLLKQENIKGKFSENTWELIEFATFQCTLRALHLSARYEAAFNGITTTYYGNAPDVPAVAEGGSS